MRGQPAAGFEAQPVVLLRNIHKSFYLDHTALAVVTRIYASSDSRLDPRAPFVPENLRFVRGQTDPTRMRAGIPRHRSRPRLRRGH